MELFDLMKTAPFILLAYLRSLTTMALKMIHKFLHIFPMEHMLPLYERVSKRF